MRSLFPFLLLSSLFTLSLVSGREIPTKKEGVFATTETRIIGGATVPSNNPYPWTTLLRFGCSNSGRVAQCAGSLIEPNVVLTAAHCWDFGCQATPVGFVTVGRDAQEPEEGYPVVQRVQHAGYDDQLLSNDIAIWRVDGSFNIKKYPTLKKKTPKEGQKVRAAGWGVTEEGQVSQILKSAQVEVQPNETCAGLFGTYQEETQLCAGTDGGGDDTCNGDSGGPLFVEKSGCQELVGLTSYGSIDCGSLDGAVYTRLSAYDDWIEGALEEVGVKQNKSSKSCGSSDGSSTGIIIGVVVGVVALLIVVGVVVYMMKKKKSGVPEKSGSGGYRPQNV